MLPLPNVTLVIVDDLMHDMTAAAVRECTDRVSFADVLLFTDKQLDAPGRWIQTSIGSADAAESAYWYLVPQHVKSSHFLVAQWDSWIIDPEMWTDRFLEFDYVGAPWWYNDRNNVGNGGFSLRSMKLAKYLMENKSRFPFQRPEDDTLCRKFGDRLKSEGIKFADDETARRFSHEYGTTRASRHFGFHSIVNFPHILTGPDLIKRLQMLSPYLEQVSVEQMTSMWKNAMDLLHSGKGLGYHV